MKTLRVATLNLWNKSGPWPERLSRISEELAALEPDVIGFQELLRLVSSSESEEPVAEAGVRGRWRWSSGDDQLSEIAETLEPAKGLVHLAFFQAKSFGGGLVMGNGLLSRHPIVEVRGFPLPGAESGETRSMLYALLETPSGHLPVFVTHLNWKWHHGSVRVRQVAALVDYIERVCPLGEPREDLLPPVLMGDFNAEPDSDEIRFLRGLHTLEGKSVYFADAWLWAGDGTAGYTFERQNGFAARSNEPPRRIDYVFVRGPDAWLRGEPVAARRAFVEPRQARVSGETKTVWASDHYGLVVELAAERRSPPE